MQAVIIGMDFGTTNSGMAVYDGERLRLIPLDPANANPHVARSALYITNDRGVNIGRQAVDTYYRQNLNRPSRFEQVRVGEIELTFAELPSFIRDVFIEKDIYSPGRLFLSFKMGLSSTNYLGTIIGSHYYFLEDIIAVYLYVARKRAEQFLETNLNTIVLGRPVRFSENADHNDLARERLLQAAFRAGYKTVYLQYEPIAAAHYYETTIDHPQNVLIFDFGGGTLDISILRLGGGERHVLANGGVPIAGDVFDSKIARAKLPPHFGEGTTYRATNQDLPVPNSYFEAFANWQDLLLLQRTEHLERLKQVQAAARSPLKLAALINLITSHYGLKMFDLAEASKRQLSGTMQTLMQFDGPGFTVRELLTRTEFERLIRPDVRVIGALLDEVVAQAGLNNEQIDAVIRTGGSSQIPAFIELLESRFGADKVRDIDAFSSVTSGLGIIAHQVESGELALKAYHADEQRGGDYLNSRVQSGIPVVDLDLMKRLINLREDQHEAAFDAQVIIAGAPDDGLSMVEVAFNSIKDEVFLKSIGLDAPTNPVDRFSPDERVLLITSDFRCLNRSARELADIQRTGLNLATIEGFHSDAFGRERVCALARWSALENTDSIVMLNTRGYARLIPGEHILDRLNQPLPYQMAKGRGYPAALLPASNGSEVLVFNAAGRAVRMCADGLSTLEARLMSIPASGEIIGAFSLDAPAEIIVATANGYAGRVHSADIPMTNEFNTNGEKVSARAGLVTAQAYQPEGQLWALTTRRLVPVEAASIPLHAPGESSDHKLLKLKKGESLVALVLTPPP